MDDDYISDVYNSSSSSDSDAEIPMVDNSFDESDHDDGYVWLPVRIVRESDSDSTTVDDVIVPDSETEDMPDPGNQAAAPNEETIYDGTEPFIVDDARPITTDAKDEPDGVAPNNEFSRAVKVNDEAIKLNTSSEDDGIMCSICFEPWTSSGEHRLVSLRCGHLFGRTCITKWVKNQNSKCPQCNARARKSEIRPLYAKSIKTLDTSERDWALRELEKEADRRKLSEVEAARQKLKCEMLSQEIELLKANLMQAQMQLKEQRTGNNGLGKLSQPTPLNHHYFTLIKCLDLKFGTCRVMDCSSILGLIAVAHQSTNPLFPGYGLRKISVPDATLTEFVHLHTKQIRDVSFRNNDGLVLTASLDKTVKISNFLTNNVVQSYTLDCDVWSCAWDLDDPCYFYAGGRTGAVSVFDIRMTSRHVCLLPGYSGTSPVVSLQYLKHQPSANHNKCGPIIGQLGGCCIYGKSVSTISFLPNPLPLEGNFTSLSCEPTTGHLLTSCRPSAKNPKVTHTLCEMSYQGNAFSCNYVHSVTGGTTQPQLSRSKLMLHPDNDSTVLICAGDAESKSTMVWNGCTGSLIDKLPAESPILDITTFRWDKPILATLTDKSLYFYNWNSL